MKDDRHNHKMNIYTHGNIQPAKLTDLEMAIIVQFTGYHVAPQK